jgi:hypothetical protein
MAITRAQQARQMLKEGTKKPAMQGGGPNYLGKQPEVTVPKKWKSSPDHPDTELAYITEPEKKVLIALNMHGGLEDGKPNKGPKGVMSLQGDMGSIGGGGSKNNNNNNNNNDGGSDARESYIRDYVSKQKVKGGGKKKPGTTGTDPSDYEDYTVTGDDVRRAREDVGKSRLESLYKTGVPKSNLPGFLGMGLNAITPFRNFTLRKNIDYFEGLKSRNRLQNYPPTLEGYTQYMKDRSAGTIDAAGNPVSRFDDDNDNSNFIPVYDGEGGGALPDDPDDNANDEDEGLNLRFRKDGGRINAMDGGIMNTSIIGGAADGNIDEMGRQMYFVGKLVKKATRAVKKIAKSPIGKAALLAGSGYLLGGGTVFGKALPGLSTSGGFAFRNIMPNLFGVAGSDEFGGTKGILGKLKLTEGFGALKPTMIGGITAASAIAGMLTPEQEEEAQLIADETGIDIAEIRANPDKYLARRFRADGGIMRLGYQEGSKEPVAKKTMPLLDMGGKEMDLREDGGFVPLGRMERADDVPARLSKNEFVFTADAVRNAGDGDVDKGAEVMYNMMKNLESGGDVSEESQGLEGAREMFQTSQRLEEVL